MIITNNIINDNVVTNKSKRKHHQKLQISDHLYKTLIIGGSGSGKTISLLSLINH